MDKRDQACIWAKHCDGDPLIKTTIEELNPGQPVHLLVDGSPTLWVRMNDGTDGRPTYGIRIVGDRSAWQRIPLGKSCEIVMVQNAADKPKKRSLFNFI